VDNYSLDMDMMEFAIHRYGYNKVFVDYFFAVMNIYYPY
jgi:hypothetical protein